MPAKGRLVLLSKLSKPKEPIPISRHRKFRNAQILKKMAPPPATAQTKTKQYSPEIQSILAMFEAMSNRMVDIHQESKEQRQILGELISCLGILKRSVDALARQLKE